MTILSLDTWHYVSLVLSACVTSEMFMRAPLKVQVSSFVNTIQNAVKVLSSKKITERRKETIVIFYANRLTRTTASLGKNIIILTIPLGFNLWIITDTVDDAINMASDLYMMVGFTLILILYYLIRLKINAKLFAH